MHPQLFTRGTFHVGFLIAFLTWCVPPQTFDSKAREFFFFALFFSTSGPLGGLEKSEPASLDKRDWAKKTLPCQKVSSLYLDKKLSQCSGTMVMIGTGRVVGGTTSGGQLAVAPPPMPEGQGSRLLPKKGTGWQPWGTVLLWLAKPRRKHSCWAGSKDSCPGSWSSCSCQPCSWVGGSWAIQEKAQEREPPCQKEQPKKKETPWQKEQQKKKETPCPKEQPKKKETPCPKEQPKKKETPCQKEQAKKKETPCQKEQEKKDAPGQKGQKESVPPEGSKDGESKKLGPSEKEQAKEDEQSKGLTKAKDDSLPKGKNQPTEWWWNGCGLGQQ